MGALKDIKTQRGKMVVGGLLGSVIAGGIFLNSLSTTGTERKSAPFPAFLPIVFDVSGTGSTSATQRYDAACIPNPLANAEIDTGSGVVVRVTYHNISNPNGAAGDIGFVTACDDHSASGSSLIDNFGTATGAVAHYTTGTAVWNGGQFIKVTHSKNPTTGYDAKVTVWIEDLLGE